MGEGNDKGDAIVSAKSKKPDWVLSDAEAAQVKAEYEANIEKWHEVTTQSLDDDWGDRS